MDTSIIMQWLFLFVLLILSALFSSAETALTTVNKMRIRTLVEEGNKKAVILTKIHEQSAKMLSTVLIINNIVNIVASAMATALAIKLWGSVSIGIVTFVLTLLILVFGEITPKTLATLYSEELALAYASVILFLMTVLTPLIIIINYLSILTLKLFRINASAKNTAMTENELKTIVDVSHEDGVIESAERKMIYNVFEFGDSLARDIMIPRIDICSVESSASYDEVHALFRKDKYTRIPVYEEATDNIIGMIIMKDFFLVDSKRFFKIRDILRDVYYTYEYKKTSELMVEMRKEAMNMAVVLNEYGAAVGIITMEDLLEEIVGELRDEYDEDEIDLIKEIAEREYIIEASIKLDDLNDALGLELFSEDYDSVGGLIIGLLDRLPTAGEAVVTADNITLEVISTSKNRIDKVHMYLPEPQSDSEETASDFLQDLSSPDEISREDDFSPSDME